MTPAGTLPPQDWLVAKDTRAVIAALTARGARVRFVGGCVRDAILDRRVQDIDIATPDIPETVVALLTGAGFKAIPTGIEHGTVTAVAFGRPFEVTTLRRDVRNLGRKAVVAFTGDWAADAERRDFTVNAIYCDPDGALYDPTGGVADLHAGRVRFVGDPSRRIEEDYLRVLRFFRFYAHYGRPPIDPDALVACGRHAKGLAILSAERIAHEVLRLLAAPDPAAALRLMDEVGVLAEVLPGATDFDRVAALTRIDGGDVVPVRRLAAALSAVPAEAGGLAERLKLSSHDRDRLTAAVQQTVPANVSSADARHLVYRLGHEAFADQVFLRWAEADGRAGDARFAAPLAVAGSWQKPALPVTGEDVMTFGVPKGPLVGKLLRAVEDWWIVGDFAAGRDEMMAKLHALANGWPPQR